MFVFVFVLELLEAESVDVEDDEVEEVVLPLASSTLNCADCARMPVLSSSLETKLIW